MGLNKEGEEDAAVHLPMSYLCYQSESGKEATYATLDKDSIKRGTVKKQWQQEHMQYAELETHGILRSLGNRATHYKRARKNMQTEYQPWKGQMM